MQGWRILAVILAFQLMLAPGAYGVGSSTNYRVDEDFIGGGGLTEESSTNYKAGESIGDIGVGYTNSTNYQIHTGYTTTADPTLAFGVNTSSINLGSLTTSATKTATATFFVKNFTSSGYIVQIYGNAPTNGTHTLAAPSTQTASATGTEQYAINLKDNATPNIGANPSGGTGIASTGYDIADQYKYVATDTTGSTIAQAGASSLQTDFTISFIANVASTTPRGTYTGTHVLVCTASF